MALWYKAWDEDGRLVADQKAELEPSRQDWLGSYRRDYGPFVQPLGPEDPKSLVRMSRGKHYVLCKKIHCLIYVHDGYAPSG